MLYKPKLCDMWKYGVWEGRIRGRHLNTYQGKELALKRILEKQQAKRRSSSLHHHPRSRLWSVRTLKGVMTRLDPGSQTALIPRKARASMRIKCILVSWRRVDLQYRVSFSVQHSDSIFLQIIFHYRLLQDNGYNSLCYTVYPCCLSILYIVDDIC